MSVNELKQKKLINEFNRKLEGETPDTLQKNSNIPEDILKFQSIEGIVTDPENRTLWINGMPYGNVYAVASSTATENGPFHAEVFNDFETNTTESDYSHVEGLGNTIGIDSTGSHAEGIGNKIGEKARGSHIEGTNNEVNCVENGFENFANNIEDSLYNHVEGINNKVNGSYNHIEGYKNTAVNKTNYIHSEGYCNKTLEGANYSHVEGYYNQVKNDYEHAQGKFNYSDKYFNENGGDEVNDGNAIISSVGVGINENNTKNAVRINRDGAVYLGSVIKRTDRVTEVFDPCNYSGQSIYDVNRTGSSQKVIKSVSVQELLSNINHAEETTYWNLRKQAESGKLLPGKSYRITDYNIGLNSEFNTFINDIPPKLITSAQSFEGKTVKTNENEFNRFDIIVTAVSTTEFSENAKAVAHKYYGGDIKKDYFLSTDFNAWQLNYDFFNDSEKYPWINTVGTEPTISISFPNNIYQQACGSEEKIGFDNKDILEEFFNDNEKLISRIYFKTDTALPIDADLKNSYNKDNSKYEELSGKYIYANDIDYNIVDRDEENNIKSLTNLILDSSVYSYEGSYYYLNKKEISEIDWNKNIANNNPDANIGKVIPTTKRVHHYNYKWILNNENNTNTRAFEFCLLTNEADFSYMKTNNGQLDTNILFCKNDKQLDVTKYNGIDDEIQYYELAKNFPYIIQVERHVSTTSESGETNDTKLYSAFIYDGPYTGNYGEITEPTHDLFYILDNYDPKENIYTVNKDFIGSKSIIVKTRIDASGVETDYTNQNFINNTEFDVREVKYEASGLNDDEFSIIVDKEEENSVLMKVSKDTMSSKYPGYNTDNASDATEEYFKLSEFKYVYKGIPYVVWVQSSGTNKEYFIISNPNTEDINNVINNVNDVKLIICPTSIMKSNEWGGQIKYIDILEYRCIGITNMEANNNPVNIKIYNNDNSISDTLENFKGGNYGRSENTVFQNERYYVLFNPVISNSNKYDYGSNTLDENPQYRCLNEYTLDAKYEIDSTTNFKENFKTVVYLEESLIPICYVTLDTARSSYYKEGKYENTGTIYRLIDEFGNDVFYDFKNIKIYNGTYNDSNLSDKMLAYSYTFDGIVKDKELVEEIVYAKNSNGNYYDSENKEYTTIEGNEDKLVTEKDEFGNTKTIKEEKIITNPYEKFSSTGDMSLTGKIINNKIYSETDNGIKDLPSNFFRLDKESKLINNTFINCNNTGSNNYESILKKGSLINFSNNLFKECNGLDLFDYNDVSGSYFYKTTGKLNCIAGYIINSTFVDTSFAQIQNDDLNFLNSQLYSCINYGSSIQEIREANLGATDGQYNTLTKNSVIYNGEINKTNDIGTDMLLTNLSGININKNFNSIEATTPTEFSILSNGYTHIIPSSNCPNISGSTISPSYTKYTQNFYYDTGTYNQDYSKTNRDDGRAKSNIVTYTFSFNKNTLTDFEDGMGGYNYTFPKDDIFYGNFSGSNPATFNLGIFYVKHHFRCYTRKSQTHAVEFQGILNMKITVYQPGSDQGIKLYEGSTNKKYGGYWSENTWSSKYLYSFFNTKMLTGIDPKFYTNGEFIISENGVLNINKIVIEISGETYANSTGNYDSVGTVEISSLYHVHNNSNNKFSSLYGTKQGEITGEFIYPYIYYYKPSIYHGNLTTGKNHEFYFGKNGLLIVSDGKKVLLSVKNNGELDES